MGVGCWLLALVIVLWALVLCVYAVTFAFGVGAAASLPAAVWYFIYGRTAAGFFILGAGITLAGLFLLLLPAGAAASRGVWRMTKGILLWIKARFVGRED